MTSYKKMIKELPEFDLTIDKRNMVYIETKFETTMDWRGSAGIELKEENNNVSLAVIRRGVTVFKETYLTEEEANQIMLEKIEHLKQMVELECAFTL